MSFTQNYWKSESPLHYDMERIKKIGKEILIYSSSTGMLESIGNRKAKYDVGHLLSIGNDEVVYDVYGKMERIGSAFVTYCWGSGRIDKIGDECVKYDYYFDPVEDGKFHNPTVNRPDFYGTNHIDPLDWMEFTVCPM